MAIKVIDGDGNDKYYEATEEGTALNPFQSVVPSYDIAHAEKEIFETYGDNVSVWQKAKTLIKFGKNTNIGTATRETVWNTGGIEVIKTANTIDTIVSSNAGDTQDVLIEGHTIIGNDLTFIVQTVTLNGTTDVAITPLARCTRALNINGTDLLGTVTITDSVAGTTHITILGGDNENQSKKCSTALSSTDYLIINQLSGGISDRLDAIVSFEFQIKPVGGVWRTVREYTASSYIEVPLTPPLIVPKNYDIRTIAISSRNNTGVIAEFSGYLAKVI